ncbi:SDR family oxidoreductase [Rubellimicrobium sp. CFH 75288]|uniref:SDR family oxidoreductase n=1 Tax=Rubellimicrobium sp. CFH 75288 TaxID=2697034 RepID=UPI0014121AAF|nr:SDR family oxidoreductase [Rubellimicrobium sp. CFH 75288]NAZ36132.1 SDR family oxidoreductase [Rubellimicrobium sp. CFH 75288]
MGAHEQTVAVVTGGTQGLGLAVAEALRAEGCTRLLLAGRDRARGEAAAARVGGVFVAADMGDPGQAAGLIDAAAARWGRVTALVNAAAVTDRASVLDCTVEEWDRQFAVNARGPFFALQRLAQRAVEGGHPAGCVNILSMVVHCGQSFLAPYSASKAALANVTKNAAQALRRHRIRVNGINCGWMDTPGEDATQRRWHGAGDDWLERAEASAPMGMLVKPEHVAALVCYLLSKRSGVMTGALVDFDQNVAGAYPE